MKPCFRLLLTLGLAASATPAAALDAHLGGFGSASLSCFDYDAADYVVNDQPRGPGRSGRCDAGLDSLLGVQLDLGLGDTVDLGVQLVADRNADRSYTPDLSVAQLRWHPTHATTVRLGRMPTAAFLHSEDRQVRYAQPWVRPPLEVYGLLPTYSNDGLEILHESSLNGWHAEWQGGVTAISFDTPVSNSDTTYPVKTRQAYLALLLRDSNTLVKLGYAHSRVSVAYPDAEALIGALRMLGPDGATLADDLAIDDSPGHMFGINVRHEQGNWLFMGEFGYRTVEGYFRDQYGAYVTLGRRFGPWMPYATLARRATSGPDSDSRAGVLQPQVEALLAASRFDATSASLGLSREIGEHAVLKFQTDWIRPDNNSWGLYTNHSPTAYDYADPGSNWLFTLSLDFIF